MESNFAKALFFPILILMMYILGLFDESKEAMVGMEKVPKFDSHWRTRTLCR
jgi:hypothetical protein